MTNNPAQIKLTDKELSHIETILRSHSSDPQSILRANILKLSDETTQPALTVTKIAELTGASRQTVTKIRNIYFDQGFDVAIQVLKRSGYETCKKNDEVILKQIQSIISEPPKNGRNRWSIRMICNECIVRGYVSYISPPTVMLILKKNHIDL